MNTKTFDDINVATVMTYNSINKTSKKTLAKLHLTGKTFPNKLPLLHKISFSLGSNRFTSWGNVKWWTLQHILNIKNFLLAELRPKLCTIRVISFPLRH